MEHFSYRIWVLGKILWPFPKNILSKKPTTKTYNSRLRIRCSNRHKQITDNPMPCFCLASLHRTPRFQPQIPWWLLELNWIRRFYQLRILIPLCWMIRQWPKTTPLKYRCCSRLSTWTDYMEGRPPSPKIEVFQLQTDSHLETSKINIPKWKNYLPF